MDPEEEYVSQQDFDNLVAKYYGTPYRELIVTLQLHGEISLADLKHTNISSVMFRSKGYITKLTNMPNNILVLEADNQEIREIYLSSSVEQVKLNRNYLAELKLGNAKSLKVLEARQNLLRSVIELPISLEEIYLDENQIRDLDLDGLSKLRVLHCEKNRMLQIHNIPKSMVDMRVEEGNPHIRLDYEYIPTDLKNATTTTTHVEYIESLNEYFRLKAKYEEQYKAMYEKYIRRAAKELTPKQRRQMAKNYRPKCISCGRPVGSIFKRKDLRYLAYCGDQTNPCALKIEIYRGAFLDYKTYIDLERGGVNHHKNQIISNKLNVLFKYISEEEGVKRFRDTLDEYKADTEMYNTLLTRYNESHFNEHKRELIKGKIEKLAELKVAMNTHLEEYEQTGDKIHLGAAVNVYVKEYEPEVVQLRRMKYGIMEMNGVPTDDRPVYHMYQQPFTIADLNFIFETDGPSVLHFNVGAKPPPAKRTQESDEMEQPESDEMEQPESDEMEQPESDEIEQPENEGTSTSANSLDTDDSWLATLK